MPKMIGMVKDEELTGFSHVLESLFEVQLLVEDEELEVEVEELDESPPGVLSTSRLGAAMFETDSIVPIASGPATAMATRLRIRLSILM